MTIAMKRKDYCRVFVWIYLPIILLLAILFVISSLTGIPSSTFMSDPAVLIGEKGLFPFSTDYKINPFASIISQIGLLFWCSTATVCLFTSYLSGCGNQRKYSPFLKYFGIFSLFLLFDDLLLFHESIAPKLLRTEKLVYVIYFVLFAFGTYKFRKNILTTNFFYFCLSILFFALSILTDVFMPYSYIWLEDGLKIFGIASWFSYFAITSFQIIQDLDAS